MYLKPIVATLVLLLLYAALSYMDGPEESNIEAPAIMAKPLNE
jgi:hypothetical protein